MAHRSAGVRVIDILDILTGVAGEEADARARMPLPDGPMRSLATLGVPPILLGDLAGGIPLSRITDVAWPGASDFAAPAETSYAESSVPLSRLTDVLWRDANAVAPDEQGIGRGTPARAWSDRDNNVPRIVVRPRPLEPPMTLDDGAEIPSNRFDSQSYPNIDANVDPALVDDRFDLRERDTNNLPPRGQDSVGNAAARGWDDFAPTGYDPIEPWPPLDVRTRNLPAPTELDEATQARDDGRSRDDLPQQVESGGWGNNVPRIVVTPRQFEPRPTPQDHVDVFSYRPGAQAYQPAAARSLADLPAPDNTYVPPANLPRALPRPSVGSVSLADLASPSEETMRALFPPYTSKIELWPLQPRGPELRSYTPPPSERIGDFLTDTLMSLGADRHRARHLGNAGRDLAQFSALPGLADFAFYLDRGDAANAAWAAPALIPGAGGVRAAARRLAANAARGRAFERSVLQALNLAKNNKLITIQGVGRSIPDALTRGVVEIKSGIEVNNSIQLIVHAAYARLNRIPFNLVVGPATQRISQSVQRLVAGTGGTIQRFNPATGVFGPFR